MDHFIEEVLFTQEEIVELSKKLGKKISEDYDGKVPVLIGLLKGSIPFLAELMKHITIDMEIDFMHVSSYRGTTSSGAVVLKKDLSDSIKGRHVLLIEDIVDTGLTIKEVVHLLQDRNTLSVEIVTLLDKPEGRTVQGIQPKYVGAIIPKKFVVGFGLDFDGLYRNLNYIGVLKPSMYQK
jgi:hypoxanthine phosphoribosyltransferase